MELTSITMAEVGRSEPMDCIAHCIEISRIACFNTAPNRQQTPIYFLVSRNLVEQHERTTYTDALFSHSNGNCICEIDARLKVFLCCCFFPRVVAVAVVVISGISLAPCIKSRTSMGQQHAAREKKKRGRQRREQKKSHSD